MKITFTAAASALLLMVSCNNKKPGETITATSADGKEKVTINMSDMNDAIEDMEKTKEKLANLKPLEADAMKAMLPEQLAGARRVDLDVQQAMGTMLANGRYQVTDTSWVEITIMDCAGSAGSGLFSTQYLSMMNIQDEDEDEYTKTIDFKGRRAIENCQKKRLECMLTYFAGDRFLVSLDGQFVGIDAVKRVANDLKL